MTDDINDEPLPDIGPPPEVPDPLGFNALPDIGEPQTKDGGPFPGDFERFRETAAPERENDKYNALEFFESEQERHRQQSQFNNETIRTFTAMGRDLADDFYLLHELRSRYEASRADLADFGM